jgi:hypothetical protein
MVILEVNCRCGTIRPGVMSTGKMSKRKASPPAQRDNRFRLAALLALMGALSAVMTIFSLNAASLRPFLGAVFGAIIGSCLALSGVLGAFGALRFTAAATAAYFLSFLASFGAQLALGSFGLLTDGENWSMGNPGCPSPVALLVGGLVGGFLIIGEVLVLVAPRLGKARTLLKAMLWSAVSGVLAVVGWVLASSPDAPLLHLVHSLHLEGPWFDPQTYIESLGPAPLVYSVYLIWQAGTAFVIGLVVKLYGPVSETKGLQR